MLEGREFFRDLTREAGRVMDSLWTWAELELRESRDRLLRVGAGTGMYMTPQRTEKSRQLMEVEFTATKAREFTSLGRFSVIRGF